MCIVDWIIAVAKSSMGGLAFYILMGIVILFVISVIVTNKDKIHTILIVTIGAFYLLSKVYCGPSLIDIYRMKPMAEKISEYIVKNGISKSLKDIPDLPYELEGCKRSEEYLNSDNNGGMKEVEKEKAILYNLREKCYFKNIELSYWLQRDLKENATGISLVLVSDNSTYVEYGGGAEKDDKIVFNEKNIGSSKTSGICNPMRQ